MKEDDRAGSRTNEDELAMNASKLEIRFLPSDQ